jgi:hypothetical protein
LRLDQRLFEWQLVHPGEDSSNFLSEFGRTALSQDNQRLPRAVTGWEQLRQEVNSAEQGRAQKCGPARRAPSPERGRSPPTHRRDDKSGGDEAQQDVRQETGRCGATNGGKSRNEAPHDPPRPKDWLYYRSTLDTIGRCHKEVRTPPRSQCAENTERDQG